MNPVVSQAFEQSRPVEIHSIETRPKDGHTSIRPRRLIGYRPRLHRTSFEQCTIGTCRRPFRAVGLDLSAIYDLDLH